MKNLKTISVALAFWFALQVSVAAHGSGPPKDVSGIPIIPLSHGQMTVISEHRNEIHILGTWTAERDDTVARLLDFSRRQYANCLWGWFPSSIADEASPFNECSHAYLAADRAILLRIRELNAWPEITNALFDKVERGMIQSGSSLVLCEFSSVSFNTASPVTPHWRDLLDHPPSLLTVASVMLITISALVLVGFRVTQRGSLL